MIEVVVSQKAELTPRVCLLTLSPTNSTQLPGWEPGAHIDLHLPNGLIRQYSLCGKLSDSTYTIAVQIEPEGKGGSKYIHHELTEGAKLTISEPRNHFPLTTDPLPAVFFAAGIGITPFLPMIELSLLEGRNFTLHYAVKHADDSLLSRDYMALQQVRLHNKSSQQERMNIARALTGISEQTHIYACGPAAFIADVLSLAAAAGIPEKQLHREFFSAQPIDHNNDGRFEVEIASTGQVIPVEKDQSLLNALEDAGLFVPVSCEEGVCGTCVTPLLSGEADHKDVFLTEQEKSQMDRIAVCCSRARSPKLVLDL